MEPRRSRPRSRGAERWTSTQGAASLGPTVGRRGHFIGAGALLLFGATIGFACDRPAPRTPRASAPTGEATNADEQVHAEAVVALDLEDPQTCVPCHATVVAEWEMSQHAHAHHDRDPIYGFMRAMRVERQGEGILRNCANCHTPRDTADHESAAARAGVSCASCHTVEAVGEGHGAAAFTAAAPATLLGPHVPAVSGSPAHGTGQWSETMRDGRTLCLACHGAMGNPAGLPTCTTGPEHALVAGEATCVSCHMPQVSGASGAVGGRPAHRSHAFAGPHYAARSGVPTPVGAPLEAALEAGPDGARLTLATRSGHDAPSGFPGRMGQVRAIGLDADEHQVWSSDDEPQAPYRMQRWYTNDAGEPEMAPFATQLVGDTRARWDQPFVVTLPVPDQAVIVQVEVHLHFVPRPLLERMGEADNPRLRPVRWLQRTWRREGDQWRREGAAEASE
jgi:hypothetical protein